VTTRSSTLPLRRVNFTNPSAVGAAGSRSLSLTRADMAHGGPAGDFGGVGVGGGDDGSGGEVGSSGRMVRSPTGDVPEAVRRVLENEALVLLGDVFRRNGHEIRLAGGVVSVASPCVSLLLSDTVNASPSVKVPTAHTRRAVPRCARSITTSPLRYAARTSPRLRSCIDRYTRTCVCPLCPLHVPRTGLDWHSPLRAT
jgi:hypothetical protein